MIQEVDVVVVGGGPAGLCAAIASARNGASTALIERYGHLGGMATGGLVILVGPFHSLIERGISGIPFEIIASLVKRDWATWEKDYSGFATVDPEGLKFLAHELVVHAYVELFLHSWAVDGIKDGSNVRGVIIESKAGRQAILAKIIIDCSGDADIAARVGVPFETFKHPWGVSLDYRIGGVNYSKFVAFKEERPREWEEVKSHLGELNFDEHFFPTNRSGMVWCTKPYFPNADPLDPADLANIEFNARHIIFQGLEFCQNNVPGFEGAFIVDTAPQIGVRETRLIKGEYVFTMDDIAQSTLFKDRVMAVKRVGSNPIVCYLPYRSLVPREVGGLLVAGRSISCTHEALNEIREIAPCMAMGQAAGTAAALAVERGIPPRRLPVSDLQTLLRNQNVILE